MSVPPDGLESGSRKLWGGRFQGGLAPEMVPLNDSLAVDFRLWREDIQGSRAWAKALAGAGVLTKEEARRIDGGLAAVGARLEREGPGLEGDEDIHSLVERLLYDEVGEVAGKLHTGRSRNDQVATDLRLWGVARIEDVVAAVEALLEALLDLAHRSLDVVMPGYTHLQQAQVVRGAHWALAHFWALLRDRDRLVGVRNSASVLPLGSGAVAGCPFPVDRELLRQELGFGSISENSVDAVGDRDWVAELAFAGAMIGIHLSRLGEDLVLFSASEFGFLEIGEGYCTGSSLMPQKRNPDVAELARGKAGRLLGNLMALLTLLKALPTGYNRDLQEDKAALFSTVDTLLLVLPPVAGAIRSVRFFQDRIEAVLSSQLLATDLAEYLVARGKPFRESHELVGRLVRVAEKKGVGLHELSDGEFAAVSEEFRTDVREIFSWERSLESRGVSGGTARTSVLQQMEAARARLRG